MKWAQHRGLCRACGRAAGIYTLSTIEADRERMQRQLAAVPAPVARPPVSVPRPRLAGDMEMVSIWHGRDPLPGASDAAGLGSTLSGTYFSVGKRL